MPSFTSVNLFSQTSKVGTTAAAFLEIGPGAVATAMGGAFVSIANDATALYWNPAGISDFTNNEVTIFHANWIASTNFDYAALLSYLWRSRSHRLKFYFLIVWPMKR